LPETVLTNDLARDLTNLMGNYSETETRIEF